MRMQSSMTLHIRMSWHDQLVPRFKGTSGRMVGTDLLVDVVVRVAEVKLVVVDDLSYGHL